jgi:hypothetical protein
MFEDFIPILQKPEHNRLVICTGEIIIITIIPTSFPFSNQLAFMPVYALVSKNYSIQKQEAKVNL